MWPQQFMSWFDHRGWFGQTLDHMGWFALQLLVKFKPPGWFYFTKYACSDFWDWENSVKVWWVTGSKSNEVSRHVFALVILAGDMICVVVGNKLGLSGMKNLVKRILWSRLVNSYSLKIHFEIKKKNLIRIKYLSVPKPYGTITLLSGNYKNWTLLFWNILAE